MFDGVGKSGVIGILISLIGLVDNRLALAEQIILDAPRFTVGTRFTLDYTKKVYKMPRMSWARNLVYQGEGNNGPFIYDFGVFEMTAFLGTVRKDWNFADRDVRPVKFPLIHGDSWTYVKGPYKTIEGCGQMTEQMTATVDDKMVTVTVADQTYDGVWINHTGYWESTQMCGRGKQGKVERGYLFVPDLGFYVEGYTTQYQARSSAFYFTVAAKMTAFSIPVDQSMP